MSKAPKGFHTITPQICVSNADAAIALYRSALGAKELNRMLVPGSKKKVMHAALEIGDSKLFVHDAWGGLQAPKGGKGGSSFYIYVDNVDRAHKQAIKAGMKQIGPPTDMFWGDRMSHLSDRFGHSWNLAARVREVSPADMEAGMREQFAAMSGPKAKRKSVAVKKDFGQDQGARE